MFSQRDNARDLLLTSLPGKITRLLDMDSIEVSSESFVDYKLAAHHSDILIRANMQSSAVLVYILVEHKSYPERWTVFQLLKYMVRIWEREIRQNRRAKKLSAIIPIIFYHGMRKWKFPLDFPSYFAEKDELEAYIHNYRLLIIQLDNN